MRNKKLVIFDFDGVIVDTIDLGFEINKKDDVDLKRKEWEDMHLGNFYANSKDVIKTPVEDFYKKYERKVYDIPLAGSLEEVIKKLSKRYKLTIVSSSPARIISIYLERNNIRAYFCEILGLELHKSKTEKFKKLLNDLGMDSNNCLFITDTLGDVREASSMGIQSIGVTWGLHKKSELKREKLIAMADRPVELINYAKKYFSQKE